MGKGTAAALLAGMIRTALRVHIEQSFALDTMIHSLNRLLCNLLEDLTIFATCAIARIDPAISYIEVANGGHCPVLFLRSGKVLSRIESSGPPLGLFSDAGYRVERLSLKQSESMLFVTDGLFEWRDGGKVWGWEAFEQFVRGFGPISDADHLWQALQALQRRASPPETLSDDQTLLFWRRDQNSGVSRG
jgi:serine phosphatase RsbU (regulator of sigma subunit)